MGCMQVALLRWTNARFTRLFAGTELLGLWYRSLGAKVAGQVRCLHTTGGASDWTKPIGPLTT